MIPLHVSLFASNGRKWETEGVIFSRFSNVMEFQKSNRYPERPSQLNEIARKITIS